MAKIVYNNCYGGFGLSDKAIRRYAEIKGIKLWIEGERHSITYWLVPPEARKPSWDSKEVFYSEGIERDDPALAQVVEELGAEANGMCAKLVVEEVPDGTAYRIDVYDGNESLHTSSEWRCARGS